MKSAILLVITLIHVLSTNSVLLPTKSVKGFMYRNQALKNTMAYTTSEDNGVQDTQIISQYNEQPNIDNNNNNEDDDNVDNENDKRNTYKIMEYKNKVQSQKLRKLKSTSFWFVTQQVLRLVSRKRNSVLDGTTAGDYGLDVFGICSSKERLDRMIEIELKHSRIAMLASAGWPISEIYHEPLIKLMNLEYESQLTLNGLAPTVLNGELLHGPNAAGLGVFFVLYSMFEYYTFNYRDEQIKNNKRREPGDFGFDPLGLYEYHGSSPEKKKVMRVYEVNHGRASMLAIVLYILIEAAFSRAIIDVTPLFFVPIWQLKSFTA